MRIAASTICISSGMRMGCVVVERAGRGRDWSVHSEIRYPWKHMDMQHRPVLPLCLRARLCPEGHPLNLYRRRRTLPRATCARHWVRAQSAGQQGASRAEGGLQQEARRGSLRRVCVRCRAVAVESVETHPEACRRIIRYEHFAMRPRGRARGKLVDARGVVVSTDRERGRVHRGGGRQWRRVEGFPAMSVVGASDWPGGARVDHLRQRDQNATRAWRKGSQPWTQSCGIVV